MRHLTRITNLMGCNILGVLELAALVGAMAAIIPADWPAQWLGQACLVAAGALISAFDFTWRYREVEPASLWRLVWPFTGGSMFYIPIWALLVFVPLGVTIWLLLNGAQ
jgi:hypothetical protein